MQRTNFAQRCFKRPQLQKGICGAKVAQRSDLIRRYACLLGPLFMIPGGGVRCVTGGSGRDGDSSVHALVDGLLIVPLENHE